MNCVGRDARRGMHRRMIAPATQQAAIGGPQVAVLPGSPPAIMIADRRMHRRMMNIAHELALQADVGAGCKGCNDIT